ncbi:MAG: hypothetical protein V2I82_06645 [Halieaceae bacterium]|jgi:sulfide dehydrogenase cytochrome subunit|nr:hypothetical protein [Halieaceae bacterium]
MTATRILMHGVAGTLLVIAVGAWSLDLDTLINTCNDCHGERGVSEWDDTPTIAGLDYYAHTDALWAYRERTRPCISSAYHRHDTERPATDMCAIADALDEEQIDALGEYYAALPFVAAQQPFDAKLAARGRRIHDRHCERCHSDGASNADDEASILAGQWIKYLETAFAQYAGRERGQPKDMKKVMDKLSDSDITALLHFYASQQ